MPASCFLLFVCLLNADGEATPNETSDLRVMSFNIRYGSAGDGENSWSKRRDLVREVFEKKEPDVAGLQEVLAFQLKELLEGLPAYHHVGVGRDDGKAAGEFSPIFYRHDRFELRGHGTFWLSDTPDKPGSKNWGNILPRICTWARLLDKRTKAEFVVYNTHFSHMSQRSRLKAVELIATRINVDKKRYPVLLTGDFNANDENPAIRYLVGEVAQAIDDEQDEPSPRLTDTFRTLHTERKNVGTFHGFGGRQDGKRIDYVFATPGVEVRAAAVVHYSAGGKYPSDHFPVTADVRLPKGKP